MIKSIFILFTIAFFLQSSTAQNATISGSIWVENDQNNMFNGEIGVDGVKVYLIEASTNAIVDSSFTADSQYNFPSNSDSTITPSSYYLEIPASEFMSGGNLNGLISCSGSNDADDGVDNDDNGSDGIPLTTTPFSVGNDLIEYVDFCFFFDCLEENALAATSCDEINEADIICDISVLGSFCNIMPSGVSPGNQPNPVCPEGGAPDNISWFAFVAYDGNYDITITPTGCSGAIGGNEGIQIGLYTDCTFSEHIFCSPDCSTDPVIISSNILQAGQVYYLFIDGCALSVCSYDVEIAGISIPPDLSPDDLCILDNGNLKCTDMQFSPNETVTFVATEVTDFDLLHSWSITTISGAPYTDDPNPQTDDNELKLTFSTEGLYEVCLTQIDNGCSSQQWNGSICRLVTILEILDVEDQINSNIKIVPNPTNDFLNVKTELLLPEARCQIYSINGELLMSENLSASGRIDVAKLPKGLYMLEITANNSQVRAFEKFIKQ